MKEINFEKYLNENQKETDKYNNLVVKKQIARKNITIKDKLTAYIFKNDIAKVKQILNSGVDVNNIITFGDTPLHTSVKSNNIEITKLLLNAGANIDAKDDESDIPLYYAITLGYLEMTKLLLNAGANINLLNKTAYGESFLQDLPYFPHIGGKHTATYKEMFNLLNSRLTQNRKNNERNKF